MWKYLLHIFHGVYRHVLCNKSMIKYGIHEREMELDKLKFMAIS